MAKLALDGVAGEKRDNDFLLITRLSLRKANLLLGACAHHVNREIVQAAVPAELQLPL